MVGREKATSQRDFGRMAAIPKSVPSGDGLGGGEESLPQGTITFNDVARKQAEAARLFRKLFGGVKFQKFAMLFQNAVKSCKVASKNLSDMARELDNIANVTSVGDLPQKMEAAEIAKAEVEAIILKRVSSYEFIHRDYLCNWFLSERPSARNSGRMGAMREEDEGR